MSDLRERYLGQIKAMESVSLPQWHWITSRLLIGAICLIMALLWFIPWTQTAFGDGQVDTPFPSERIQSISALVPGQIRTWHVTEGQAIRTGDPIVTLVDSDPELIQRLESQLAAANQQRIAMEQAIATETTNLDRQQRLRDQGLKSQRDLELVQLEIQKLSAEAAKIDAEISRLQVETARQSLQTKVAPSDGTILRLKSSGNATYVNAVKLFDLVGKKIATPFPLITYAEAMEKYGSDKPDLRFDMLMVELTDLLPNTGFKVFQSIATSGGCIKAINVTGKSDQMSKNMLQEEMAKKVVPSLGGKGMAWMRVENGELQSNIVQFFSEEELIGIKERLEAKDGDVLLFIADKNRDVVNDILGRLRLYVAERYEFIDPTKITPCWVTDFPLFELKDGNLTSIHHPFTAPSDDFMSASTKEELLKVNSRGYDMVINGEEVGGGSIRIHQADVQEKVFNTLGLSKDEIEEKFGWFVEALKYGTPPHGGIALGIDRLVGMLLDTDNIRVF